MRVAFINDCNVELRISLAPSDRLDTGDLDRLGNIGQFMVALNDAEIEIMAVESLKALLNQFDPVTDEDSSFTFLDC